jgi:hypothetical protein
MNVNTIYENKDGYNVATSGTVVIESVLHRIKNGYVVCDNSLNHKSWNTTTPERYCSECFKDNYFKQQKLF